MEKEITSRDRTALLRSLLGGLILVAVLGLGGSLQAAPPDIVFIIADDLGWADVGYHGSHIQTPVLDRLAAQGVRLDQYYATPTCTPTRVAVMSGLYPSRFGVLSPAYGKIFRDDTVTLPMALRKAGYRTFISGKWHMGSPPDHTPLKYGFDASYGYFHGQIDPYTHLYKTQERSWHRNDEFLKEQGHATDLITEEAERVIRAAGPEPFFLYVAYSVPHHPLKEPETWTAPYASLQSESRRWFAASVTHMDHGIGRIVEALSSSGRLENTLLIFVSDNGGQLDWDSSTEYGGSYSQLPHPVLGNNVPLRGWKGDTYEGGIRVPAIVYWKNRLNPGRTSLPVHAVDWLPTLANLAGYSGAGKWDGLDVWSAIAEGKAPFQTRTMYWKTPSETAVRSGDWKLIVGRRDDRLELFHIGKDPYETRDLSAARPERVAELKELLQKISRDDVERDR